MAYMGSGESGRGAGNRARTWGTNQYTQGRSGGKFKTKPGVVGSVRHNPREGGGINRATRGLGKGASSY